MKSVFLSHRIHYFVKLQRWHIGNIFSLYLEVFTFLFNDCILFEHTASNSVQNLCCSLCTCVVDALCDLSIGKSLNKKVNTSREEKCCRYANVAVSQSNKFGEIKRLTSSFDSQKVEASSANFKVFFRKYKCEKYTLTHFGTNKAAMLKRLTTMLSSSRTATTK